MLYKIQDVEFTFFYLNCLFSFSFSQFSPVQRWQLYLSLLGSGCSCSWPVWIQHDGADWGMYVCAYLWCFAIVLNAHLIFSSWCLQVDHWLEFSARHLCNQPDLTVALAELDKALSLRTFLVGHALTLADLSVWAALKGQQHPGFNSFFLCLILVWSICN